MTDTQSHSTRTNLALWIVGLLGLLWNAMGVLNFAMQMNSNMLASMPAEQQAIVAARPVWATIAFGIGVAAGVIGCLLLLMRKSSALQVLVVSLVAIAIHMVSYFTSLGNAVAFGSVQIVLYVILPLAVAVFLAWFAKSRPA